MSQPYPLLPNNWWDFPFEEGVPLRAEVFEVAQDPLPPDFDPRPPLYNVPYLGHTVVELVARGPFTDPNNPYRALADDEFLLRYTPVLQPPAGSLQALEVRYVEAEMIFKRNTGYVTVGSNLHRQVDPDETTIPWVVGTKLCLVYSPAYPPFIAGRWRGADEAWERPQTGAFHQFP